MACKYNCGNQNIDSQYACSNCLIKRGEYLWCVIARADDVEGNKYDEIIFLNPEGEAVPWEKVDSKDVGPDKPYSYPVSVPMPVFSVGEVFPVDPYFHRELCGAQRKPNKWDVEAEYYTDLTQALLRAVEVQKEYYEKMANEGSTEAESGAVSPS